MMKRGVVVLLLVLNVWTAFAGAQSTTLSEPDRQAILDYPLTLPRANSLIAAMQEMTAYLVSRPDFATVMARSMKMTRTEQIAQLARDPMALAIVTKHGLKPAANVTFAKANLAQLKPKVDAADGGGRR